MSDLYISFTNVLHSTIEEINYNDTNDELRKAYLQHFVPTNKVPITTLSFDVKMALNDMKMPLITPTFNIIYDGLVRKPKKDNKIVSCGFYKTQSSQCTIIFSNLAGTSRYNVVIMTILKNNIPTLCVYDPGALMPVTVFNCTTGEYAESKSGKRRMIFASPTDTLFISVGNDTYGSLIKIVPIDKPEVYHPSIFSGFGIKTSTPPCGLNLSNSAN